MNEPSIGVSVGGVAPVIRRQSLGLDQGRGFDWFLFRGQLPLPFDRLGAKTRPEHQIKGKRRRNDKTHEANQQSDFVMKAVLACEPPEASSTQRHEPWLFVPERL